MDEELQNSTHLIVPITDFKMGQLLAEYEEEISEPDLTTHIAYYLQGVILTPVAILGMVGKLF